ncbi:hemerythrin domain-containing protein [Oryzomonas rubra]|uniref:Cation-binding protein n=1 Tax=Oryzomonas rubra TaxID=2509454 RepID=A0A5A9XB96_9BACT|nr:hemerythrin domain-containing protein [Oryzomonas rubra]KAA0890422.1 cation-binding protein [Oryzomonas rubra]
MEAEITQALVNEHRLILRMVALLEHNARRTVAGAYDGWQFYLNGVDFIRNYADRFHHAKEEDVLFAALFENGMPREHSPVAAMLLEHDQGRQYVGAMEAAAKEATAGKGGCAELVVENARAYAELLRAHIAKEDGILYPLAERLIPARLKSDITAGYTAAEAGKPAGFAAHYGALVTKYEREVEGLWILNDSAAPSLKMPMTP